MKVMRVMIILGILGMNLSVVAVAKKTSKASTAKKATRRTKVEKPADIVPVAVPVVPVTPPVVEVAPVIVPEVISVQEVEEPVQEAKPAPIAEAPRVVTVPPDAGKVATAVLLKIPDLLNAIGQGKDLYDQVRAYAKPQKAGEKSELKKQVNTFLAAQSPAEEDRAALIFISQLFPYIVKGLDVAKMVGGDIVSNLVAQLAQDPDKTNAEHAQVAFNTIVKVAANLNLALQEVMKEKGYTYTPSKIAPVDASKPDVVLEHALDIKPITGRLPVGESLLLSLAEGGVLYSQIQAYALKRGDKPSVFKEQLDKFQTLPAQEKEKLLFQMLQQFAAIVATAIKVADYVADGVIIQMVEKYAADKYKKNARAAGIAFNTIKTIVDKFKIAIDNQLVQMGVPVAGTVAPITKLGDGIE